MLKLIFNAIAFSTRALLRNWRGLLMMSLLYAAMLGAVYLFFVTREASVGQLLLSVLLVLAASALFLVVQTMAARYTEPDVGAGKLLRRSLIDFWKLLVVALPVIILVGVAVYFLGRIEFKPVAEEAVRVGTPPARTPSQSAAPQSPWQAVLASTVTYVLLCLVLPLSAVQLWIRAARDGLKSAVKGSGRALAHAFAPGSVLTYLIGFAVFALIPYLLIFTKTPSSSASLEVGLLAGRLALAGILSLVGWVATVGALRQLGEVSEAGSPGVEVKATGASEASSNVTSEA